MRTSRLDTVTDFTCWTILGSRMLYTYTSLEHVQSLPKTVSFCTIGTDLPGLKINLCRTAPYYDLNRAQCNHMVNWSLFIYFSQALCIIRSRLVQNHVAARYMNIYLHVNKALCKHAPATSSRPDLNVSTPSGLHETTVS